MLVETLVRERSHLTLTLASIVATARSERGLATVAVTHLRERALALIRCQLVLVEIPSARALRVAEIRWSELREIDEIDLTRVTVPVGLARSRVHVENLDELESVRAYPTHVEPRIATAVLQRDPSSRSHVYLRRTTRRDTARLVASNPSDAR